MTDPTERVSFRFAPSGLAVQAAIAVLARTGMLKAFQLGTRSALMPDNAGAVVLVPAIEVEVTIEPETSVAWPDGSKADVGVVIRCNLLIGAERIECVLQDAPLPE